MVWGMLPVAGPVPGTVKLDRSTDERVEGGIKTAPGKKSHIILSPQPSDDPRDPLNWPQWRKNLLLVVISLVATLTNAIGPMLSTAFKQIATEYNVSLDTATSATGGAFSLTVGLTTFFSTAGAVKYGKRPLFILSTFFLIVFSVWAYFADSIINIAVARAAQGIAAAPFETLVSSTVADLYFVHERGSKLAIWGLSIGAGLAISQVGGGAVVQYLGWKKLFVITAASFAAMFVVVLFLVPETAYVREYSLPMQDIPREKELPVPEPEATDDASSVYSAIPPVIRMYRAYEPKSAVPTMRSSNWDLLTWIPRERFSSASFWKLSFRPIPLFIYPAVLFTSIVNGLNFTFLLAFGLASLSIFAEGPYNLAPVGIGMTALPAVLAASLGQPLAGWSTDYIAGRLTRTNGGVYEPEMRLLSMLPSTLFATMGFIGFGLSVSMQQVHGGSILIPLSWYALIAFSVPWTNVAAFSYLIDSHAEVANECFVTAHFTKGLMILAVASTLNGYLARYGVMNVFLVIAGINFLASCFTIVFWIWGKRMRSWVGRNRVLRRF